MIYELTIEVKGKNESRRDMKCLEQIPTSCVEPLYLCKYVYTYLTTMEFENVNELFDFYGGLKDIGLYHYEEV